MNRLLLASRSGIFFLLCVLYLTFSNPSIVKADWVNLTGSETAPNIAEIYVNDNHVKVVLEVYVGNLEIFDDLIPDSWMKDANSERGSVEQRMRHFAEKGLQVVTDRGKQLPARYELIEPRMRKDRQSPFAGMINPYTRQRVPDAPEDKRVLYAEIVYPFKGKPQSLTFIPPRDEEGRALVTIGFITYHKAVPVIDFRYLGSAAKLNLDWSDPWYSRFDNPNLKRHHKSAMMSFLYVEPHEVRHEVLTRVKDLEAWMDLGLRGKEYIEVDELEPLKQRIGEFLLEKNPTLIDGKAYKPILDRSNYVKVGIKGIQLLEQPQRLEISTAIVGVIIAYITDGMPQQVSVDWQLFSEQINKVPATATDPAGPLPTYLTPDDNQHIWSNFLKNYVPPTVAQLGMEDTVNKLKIPLLSLVSLLAVMFGGVFSIRAYKSGRSLKVPVFSVILFMGLGIILYPYLNLEINRPTLLVNSLDQDEAKRILNGLLKNVYRSFDFREESDVYDKLALSVEGELLSEIYLQNRKSFAVKKAGGAQARVKQIEVLSVEAKKNPQQPLSFILNAKWTAMGSVGHWGHTHLRKNYYDAAVTVDVIEGAWKITNLELREEKRVEPFEKIARADTAGKQ